MILPFFERQIEGCMKKCFFLVGIFYFMTSLAFSLEVGFDKEKALEEIKKTYELSIHEGSFNSYSRTKSYYSMALSNPFMKEHIKSTAFEVLRILENYVEKIKQICETEKEEAISIYFLERYLPIYEKQAKEKLLQVALFFYFGLGETENVLALSKVKENVIEFHVKEQIAKELFSSEAFFEEIKRSLEEEKLQKTLTVCKRIQEPFFEHMYQELLHYETMHDYYSQIDLKGYFWQVLEERFDPENEVEAKIKSLISEYKLLIEELAPGLF